nr:MAG TPA: hypothetical protein [Caudoviricetes sp.]
MENLLKTVENYVKKCKKIPYAHNTYEYSSFNCIFSQKEN